MKRSTSIVPILSRVRNRRWHSADTSVVVRHREAVAQNVWQQSGNQMVAGSIPSGKT